MAGKAKHVEALNEDNLGDVVGFRGTSTGGLLVYLKSAYFAVV